MAAAYACYQDNVVGQYLNHAAREVIASFVARENDQSPIRILELGAGIGGTTADVIRGLSGMSVDYHFTDLSPFFLIAAQERFAEYPQIRYGILDLNTDLGIGQEHGYDIVLAANVVHNALHIGQTLHQLRELISPGGVMINIETCKANYQLLTSHPGHPLRMLDQRLFVAVREW
jgi:mycobactin polyketide synthetase MbtD